MWVDTRDCVPLNDGTYAVQTVYGDVVPMGYTYKGGWNTSHNIDGSLHTAHKLDNFYVVRWCIITAPPEIPQAWKNEYRTKEGI